MVRHKTAPHVSRKSHRFVTLTDDTSDAEDQKLLDYRASMDSDAAADSHFQRTPRENDPRVQHVLTVTNFTTGLRNFLDDQE